MDTTIQNQNPAQLPQNSIPPSNNNGPMNQKGFLPIILGMIVFLVVVAGGAYYIGTLQNEPTLYSQLAISPSPLPTISNQQYPSPTNSNPVQQGTNRKVIDLYQLELYLPVGWTLQELNRRPEPTNPGDPVKGHDCADYKITSNDSSIVLTLLPTCGFDDGGTDMWPSDAVIIKDFGNNGWIIRYFDSIKAVYRYANAGQAEISDENGTRWERTYASPPIITAGEGQNLTFMSAELNYTVSQSNKTDNIQKADSIIASLRHI